MRSCVKRPGVLHTHSTPLTRGWMQVTTAAITTTHDGYVHDVFQVR